MLMLVLTVRLTMLHLFVDGGCVEVDVNVDADVDHDIDVGCDFD